MAMIVISVIVVFITTRNNIVVERRLPFTYINSPEDIYDTLVVLSVYNDKKYKDNIDIYIEEKISDETEGDHLDDIINNAMERFDDSTDIKDTTEIKDEGTYKVKAIVTDMFGNKAASEYFVIYDKDYVIDTEDTDSLSL